MATIKTHDDFIKELLQDHILMHEVGTTPPSGFPASTVTRQHDFSALDHDYFGSSYANARTRAENYFSTTGTGTGTKAVGKFGTKYDEVASILKKNELLDEHASGEYAGTYSKKLLAKNQAELAKKAPAAYEKAAWGLQYHEQALEKLDKVHANNQEKLFKEFDKRHTALIKSGAPADVEKAKILQENYGLGKNKLEAHYDKVKEFHVERRDALQEFVTDLERESKISATEHMKIGAKSFGTLEKEAGAAENALEHTKPGHFGMTAGGAVAGAVVGYVASDDENKARNAAIGAAGGGIIGRIVSHFRNGASTALGAVSHERGLLAKVGGAVSHMR
ncbi:MAG: hypothetical protein KGI29_08365 [Pseudomonadota bacterium]|nr:hypothetical protein [Pseudomonadota bacterium]MDE3037118.1 hypothetical protein [Pseudomonadota bacterium]